MSWVKGDRLKVTLEVIAEEPSDETGDIWFREGRGRKWLNLPEVQESGGSYTLEVIPKPVELPTKMWATVTFLDSLSGLEQVATSCIDGYCWHDIRGEEVPLEILRRKYVRTLSEGVDE